MTDTKKDKWVFIINPILGTGALNIIYNPDGNHFFKR